MLGLQLLAAQGEDQPLGLFDHFLTAVAAFGDLGLDLVGGPQERAQCAFSRTIRPYSRACPAAGTQPASSSIAPATANRVELSALAQDVGDGQVVDLAGGVVELEHRLEHRPVLLAVEVVGA